MAKAVSWPRKAADAQGKGSVSPRRSRTPARARTPPACSLAGQPSRRRDCSMLHLLSPLSRRFNGDGERGCQQISGRCAARGYFDPASAVGDPPHPRPCRVARLRAVQHLRPPPQDEGQQPEGGRQNQPPREPEHSHLSSRSGCCQRCASCVLSVHLACTGCTYIVQARARRRGVPWEAQHDGQLAAGATRDAGQHFQHDRGAYCSLSVARCDGVRHSQLHPGRKGAIPT